MDNVDYDIKLFDKNDKVKKLHARQRIDMMLDDDSFFMELSQLAGHGLYGR